MVRGKRARPIPVVINLESEETQSAAPRTSANYKCPACNLTYACKGGVLMHLKTDHPSLRVDPDSIASRIARPQIRQDEFACPFCAKTFAQQAMLARHQRNAGHEERKDTTELEDYINSL